MTEYQYTKDWFNWAPEVWNQLPLCCQVKQVSATFLR